MLSSRLPALAQLVVTAMLFSGVFCPISTSAQTAWNICLAETGMRKVQACDKYINENSSNNKYGFYYRGVGWEESGNFVNALTDYKRYAQLSPSDYYATAAIERVAAALKTAAQSQAIQVPQQQQAAIQPQAQIPANLREGQRVALLIGNSQYRNQGLLKNPVSDTKALAAALRAAGFQSIAIKNDLTREQIIQALRDFVRDANSAGWAIVY